MPRKDHERVAELPRPCGHYAQRRRQRRRVEQRGRDHAVRVTDDNSDQALQADTARFTYAIDRSITSTGAVIRIGILSNSFNALDGAAADEAGGELPTAANAHVLTDQANQDDEGRAMAELVRRIAPCAQTYPYTSGSSEQFMATGIPPWPMLAASSSSTIYTVVEDIATAAANSLLIDSTGAAL